MSEAPQFSVVRELSEHIQIRDYGAYVAARTSVAGDRDKATQDGFGILVAFIKGANEQKQSIAMTSPVTLDDRAGEASTPDNINLPKSGAISHTASGHHEMAFMMPRQFTLQTVPKPNDPRVEIVQVPARRIAAISYHGRWTEQLYEENLQRLRDALRDAKLTAKAGPAWARYNSPMMPFFLRHNEIWLEVEQE